MSDAPDPPVLEKPLPTPRAQRPGTSGTELGLRANRRAASSAYQRAQKAEQTYRAKRLATTARTNAQEAKAHFKESQVQFAAGWSKGVSAVKCLPGVFREKRAARKNKQEVREQEKVLAKRNKLEEKMKKAGEGGGDGEGEAVAPAAAAEGEAAAEPVAAEA